jgi:hypothetical protein
MIIQWTVDDGLFVVTLIDTSGETVESVVSQYDEGPGSTFVHVPSTGQYLLKVTADSPWTVTLSNTMYMTWDSHWEDTNDRGTYAFHCTPGRLDIRWTVDNGLFVVTLVDITGEIVENLVSQYDEGPGSTAVNIKKEGDYMLKVTAESPWTVDLSGVIQVTATPPIQTPTSSPTLPPTTIPTPPPTAPPTPVPITTVPPVVTTLAPITQPVVQPVSTISAARTWGKRYAVGNPGTFLGSRSATGTAPTGTSTRRVATVGPTLKPGSVSRGVTPPPTGSFVRWYPAARWAAGIR